MIANNQIIVITAKTAILKVVEKETKVSKEITAHVMPKKYLISSCLSSIYPFYFTELILIFFSLLLTILCHE
jgi:hypothetical protein